MKIKAALGQHWVSCILLLGWRGKLNAICSMNVLFRNLLGNFKIMEILTDIGALVHFTQIIYLFILFFSKQCEQFGAQWKYHIKRIPSRKYYH